MTATAIREGARVAVLLLVLVLASVLGLVVGNAINGRSSTAVGAPAPASAPEQTDPRPHIWAEIDATAETTADHSSLKGRTPR